jgi:hypothetical protein
MTRVHHYNGIQMRSAIEVAYARFADSHGLRWEYEPEVFHGIAGHWRPDFRLEAIPLTWSSTPTPVYVEVKFRRWWAEASEEARRALLTSMATIFSSDPDAVVILEQSGIVNRPTLISMSDTGRIERTLAKWLTGANGRPILGRDLEASPWHDAWWNRESGQMSLPLAA